MTPTQFQTELDQATRLQLEKKYGRAAVIYERLMTVAPQNFQLNHLFGTLRFLQGKTEIAARLLEQARRANPRSAPTLMCLGMAYGSLGRHAEAERCLRESIRLDPRNAECALNLGGELVLLGKLGDAIECYKQAIAVKPTYAQAYASQAVAMMMMGQGGGALEQCDKALSIDPENFLALFTRAQANLMCFRVSEALADFDKHLAKHPDHLEARSYRLMALNYCDDLSPATLYAEHVEFGRYAEERAKQLNDATPLEPAPSSDRPLRIGILSPDLRKHSITYFLDPLLRELDRERFHLYLYHDHFSVDDVSRKLQSIAHVWRHTVGQSYESVFKLIRSDRLDVALDLTGHTGLNRMLLYARRLAPIQIAYLGYPNTTGLSTIDYRFTDPIADPVGMTDSFHAERLIRFSDCAWCYSPPASSPTNVPPPCLKNGYVTFGSFNALSKLNGRTLRLWAALLRQIPTARLLLKNYSFNPERWYPILQQAGLPLDRTQLLPPNPSIESHLAVYNEIDIALDPTPYNGTTTTCEALWMGVPVLCIVGDRHAARVSYSLVSAVGHSHWGFGSPEEFLAGAIRLASSQDELLQIRSTLRERMRASTLLDTHGQAKRLFDTVLSLVSKQQTP